MKLIDFTKPGGFPLTQDQLAYLQQAYTECIDVIAKLPAGTDPVLLSGMAVSGGGNTVSDGWFVYQGKMTRFNGGTVTPGGGEVAIVAIQDVPVSLTFNDGSTPNVIIEKVGSLTHSATVTDATHFPVTSLVPYVVALGRAGRDSAWSSWVVSTAAGVGGVTGTISYKKDYIANTLSIRGTLTAANAQNFDASPAGTYLSVGGGLPAGYWPSDAAYFPAVVTYSSLGLLYRIQDDSGGYFSQVNCVLNNLGQLLIDWVKPAGGIASYSASFCMEIPLD